MSNDITKSIKDDYNPYIGKYSKSVFPGGWHIVGFHDALETGSHTTDSGYVAGWSKTFRCYLLENKVGELKEVRIPKLRYEIIRDIGFALGYRSYKCYCEGKGVWKPIGEPKRKCSCVDGVVGYKFIKLIENEGKHEDC